MSEELDIEPCGLCGSDARRNGTIELVCEANDRHAALLADGVRWCWVVRPDSRFRWYGYDVEGNVVGPCGFDVIGP